jgi:AcrR family transcriptional regulator
MTQKRNSEGGRAVVAVPDENGKQPSARYDALINVATKLFSEHGYDATSVRMIADEAGLQSGSLYSHIRSKDEILTRIVVTVADRFYAAARLAIGSADGPEGKLRALCRAHLEVIDQYGDAVRVYYDEWRKLDQPDQGRIIEMRDVYESYYADVIEDGVAEGLFRSVDTRSAVRVILAACNFTYQWYSPDGPLSPAEITDSFLDVILFGLRAPGQAGSP